MMRITVTTEADVPAGSDCARYYQQSAERCSQIREHATHVGWDSGLGSPGTMTTYRCALFDAPLEAVWVLPFDHTRRGLALKKCERCRVAPYTMILHPA